MIINSLKYICLFAIFGMACQLNTGELVPVDKLDPYIG